MSKILSSLTHASHLLRKVVFWLALILLLAVVWGAYTWWVSAHAKPQYVTAEVTQGDIERSVNVTGSINPRVTVQVGSYVSGTVKSLSCDFNTEVKAGQICAKIDPSTFQVVVDQNAAQLNSTRAQLRKDEAALVYAQAVLDRDIKLLKDGIVAEEIVDNDKSVRQQAVAQIDLDKAAIVAQQASLKSAVVNLGYTNIVSPVTGTVLTRNVDVGQTVASSLQTPTLFLIGKDLTKMQVDANVSEADVGRIAVDQDVTFSVQAYPDKIFEGTVKQIRRGPITVQNVVTYDVVITVDNPDLSLFPGMTADAEIVTDARENVLRIPLAATRFTPSHASDFPHAGGASHAEKHAGDHGGNQAGDNKAGGRHADRHGDKADASATGQAGDSADANAGGQDHNARHGDHGQHHGDNAGWGHGGHRGDKNGDAKRADRHGDGHHGKRDDNNERSEKHGDQAGDKPDDKHADNHADQSDASDTSDKSDASDTDEAEAQPAKRARVWVLRDGAVQPVSITTGLDDGELVEVLSGELKPGDKIIIGEAHPVEAKSAPMPSPFGQAGKQLVKQPGGKRGMGR